jgi:hypothetical protein
MWSEGLERGRKRQREKCYEQYYHNQQNSSATTRLKTLPTGMLCPTLERTQQNNSRWRTGRRLKVSRFIIRYDRGVYISVLPPSNNKIHNGVCGVITDCYCGLDNL